MAEYASVVWMKCWFDSGTGLREVEEWFISPASDAGACRFDSGLPDKFIDNMGVFWF